MNTPPFQRLQKELLNSAEASPLQFQAVHPLGTDFEASQKPLNIIQEKTILISSKINKEETSLKRQAESTGTELMNQTTNEQVPLVSQQDEQGVDFESHNGNSLFGNNEEFLPRIEAKLYLKRNIAFFVGIGLTSLATVCTLNKTITFQGIFVVLYSYLIYCLIDNSKRIRITRREAWRVREDSISIIDNIVNLFYLVCLNLSLLNVISCRRIFAVPYILTTILYPLLSKGSKNTRTLRGVIRALFTVQIYLITLKFSQLITWNWFFVLITSGLYLIFVFGFMFSICLAFAYRLKGDDEFFRPSLKGLTWHFFYYSLGIVALLMMIGMAFFNGSKGVGLLKIAGYIGLGLSSFLVCLTVGIWKELVLHIQDFWLSDHFLLEPLPQWTTEKKQEIGFKVEKQVNYFTLISSTYFRRLENKAEGATSNEGNGRQNIEETTEIKHEEENLCYLCYEKSSNAILGACGHGGVCYECVIPLIKKKNKCMECRSDVEEIYKVEQDLENPSILKSVESSKVVLRSQ